MNERLILVTNDDGYDSKGMEAAIEVARAFGRVVVVAPETTQSGMSQAITMYNPLYLRRIREEELLPFSPFSLPPLFSSFSPFLLLLLLLFSFFFLFFFSFFLPSSLPFFFSL